VQRDRRRQVYLFRPYQQRSRLEGASWRSAGAARPPRAGEANTFFGFVAPAGTPTSVIKTLNDTLSEGVKSAEIQRLIANLGSEWKPNSPDEFAAYIALQHRKWVEVGKAAGVRID
jgi:tripartite-type tricarboxylate transporter receptor subunit TctC